MKQTIRTSRTSGQLEKMFRKLNERYFENALPEPMITIMTTKGAYGHVTCGKVWRKGDDYTYELNIGAGTLARPIEETTGTLLHEMVHIYCMENGIKDTSRGNTYHNKRFKEQAELRNLKIDYDPRIGWSITSPTEQLIEYIISEGWQDIQMERSEPWTISLPPIGGNLTGGSGVNGVPLPPKRKTSWRYTCPVCGFIARTTKEAPCGLICGVCCVTMTED